MRHAPVEDSVSERADIARPAEEQVPDLVREAFCLRVGREADLARPAPKRQCHELARGLARLDVLCEEGAVGERSPREDTVVPLVAGL